MPDVIEIEQIDSLFDLEEHQKYRVPTPAGTIPVTAVEQIVQAVFAELDWDNWHEWDRDHAQQTILRNIDWVWQTSEGTLPKRVTRYLWNEWNMSIRDNKELLSHIGNVARSNTTLQSYLYLDRTTDFRWRAGAFGDEGSCFWTERQEAKATLKEWGAGAIRIYNDGLAGVGRAWYLPLGEAIILFNVYGPFQKAQLGATLAQLLGTHYNVINLINWDEYLDGLVWLNGKRGVILGDNATNIHAVDIRRNDPRIARCESCKRAGYADDLFNVDEGKYLCYKCRQLFQRSRFGSDFRQQTWNIDGSWYYFAQPITEAEARDLLFGERERNLPEWAYTTIAEHGG